MRDKHLTRLKDTGVFEARESVVEPDKPSGKTGFSLVLRIEARCGGSCE
jgi:hypothetical protein